MTQRYVSVYLLTGWRALEVYHNISKLPQKVHITCKRLPLPFTRHTKTLWEGSQTSLYLIAAPREDPKGTNGTLSSITGRTRNRLSFSFSTPSSIANLVAPQRNPWPSSLSDIWRGENTYKNEKGPLVFFIADHTSPK